MGLLDYLTSKQRQTTPTQFNTLSDGLFWTYEKIGELSRPDALTLTNGYTIATQVGEVFFVIDTISEKVAKLFNDVYLSDKAGNEIKMPKSLEKLFAKPNIYDKSLTDLIYSFVFSELSDGNGYMYFKTAEGTTKITVDNVQALMVLNPEKVTINLKQSGQNRLTAAEISDYISNYRYDLTQDEIRPMFMLHSKSYMNDRGQSDYRAVSPLYAAKRNIDNLLAVYSARYNVYANNGAAGYISKKQSTAGMDAAFGDRDKILEDIKNRNGLVGDKNVVGISSVPIEFVSTIGTIKDLMPFDEWVADFLMIAGVFGVDKDLLPLKEGTTFTNKEVAEAKIWSDIATTYADDICADLTSMFNLPAGQKLTYKKDAIPFLESQRKTKLEGDAVVIDNLLRLKESGYDVDALLTKLIEQYGNQ